MPVSKVNYEITFYSSTTNSSGKYFAQDSTGRNNGTFNGNPQYGLDNYGLVSYYSMDVNNDSSGKTYDSSKNNNDGIK